MIFTLPDIKVIIDELKLILSDSIDNVVTQFNLLAILVDNQGCWNHFINGNKDPFVVIHNQKEIHFSSTPSTSSTSSTPSTQQVELNSKIFNYLSTIFVGRPSYQNERFLLIQYFSKFFYLLSLSNQSNQ
jgi:hypothetical protein